jgi:hypothetical protein
MMGGLHPAAQNSSTPKVTSGIYRFMEISSSVGR